jgi:hypothetical protein
VALFFISGKIFVLQIVEHRKIDTAWHGIQMQYFMSYIYGRSLMVMVTGMVILLGCAISWIT